MCPFPFLAQCCKKPKATPKTQVIPEQIYPMILTCQYQKMDAEVTQKEVGLVKWSKHAAKSLVPSNLVPSKAFESLVLSKLVLSKAGASLASCVVFDWYLLTF